MPYKIVTAEEVPELLSIQRRSKWTELFAQIEQLTPGQWIEVPVPVERNVKTVALSLLGISRRVRNRQQITTRVINERLFITKRLPEPNL